MASRQQEAEACCAHPLPGNGHSQQSRQPQWLLPFHLEIRHGPCLHLMAALWNLGQRAHLRQAGLTTLRSQGSQTCARQTRSVVPLGTHQVCLVFGSQARERRGTLGKDDKLTSFPEFSVSTWMTLPYCVATHGDMERRPSLSSLTNPCTCQLPRFWPSQGILGGWPARPPQSSRIAQSSHEPSCLRQGTPVCRAVGMYSRNNWCLTGRPARPA